MTGTLAVIDVDLNGLERLAELVALKVRRGDVIALRGDLGAGKTTFARALIRALLDDAGAEIPSPTFSLAQTYVCLRITVTHFDLYRTVTEDEIDEIGLEPAMADGLAVIEWPERAEFRLPTERLDIALQVTDADERRRLTLSGSGAWASRLERILAMHTFVQRQGDWHSATIRYLQGDASARAYARLRAGSRSAVLMDAPSLPDGPPVRDGKSYGRIAHLAEDLRPFIAVALALGQAGFSAPEIYAQDIPRGLLLLEDLGDRVYHVEMRGGTPQETLWRAAVDVLIELRQRRPPATLPLPDGSTYTLPRFDRAALEIELDLLLEWYWPEVKGHAPASVVVNEFRALWSPILDRLMAAPPGWFLRDHHSPNLIWLPDRAGSRRVGLLDFQDAMAEPWAYDLVSLLHDARVDVSDAIEARLFEHYCRRVASSEPSFDRDAFTFQYQAFGAQRRTRHLGLFVRLLRRDGKPQYLQHIPRAWEHLARNLAHPELTALRIWYERHFPPPVRATALAR